jgi:hypothetical protein
MAHHRLEPIMSRTTSLTALVSIAFAVCGLQSASATTVIAVNLDELTSHADRIFCGTVIDVRAGTVEAGGGTLPITIYRLRVNETFKGQYLQAAKGGPVVEIRTIGSPKPVRINDHLELLSFFADVPRLELGEEYLLFTTTPSSVGLSTTVGLGQGCFRVQRRQGKEALVVNGFNNDGLFRGMRNVKQSKGPMALSELSQRIRSAVAR